jgi:hypothetical protein
MPQRSRIFALILIVLLVVPFLIRGGQTGSVLGVLEDNSGSIATVNDGGGQIGGGVLENKSNTTLETSEAEGFSGLATLDKSALVGVSTDKFPLASEVEITYGNVTIDKIVGNNKAKLEDGQVVILDEKVFRELGLDPELTSSAQIQIKSVK